MSRIMRQIYILLAVYFRCFVWIYEVTENMELFQILVVKHCTALYTVDDDYCLQSSERAFSSQRIFSLSYKIIQSPDFQFPVNFKFSNISCVRQKMLIHDFMNIQMPRRWQKFLEIQSGVACSDHQLMLFSWLSSPVTPSDTPWCTMLYCFTMVESDTKLSSIIVVSSQSHSSSCQTDIMRKVHILSCFFLSNQRWPPCY